MQVTAVSASAAREMRMTIASFPGPQIAGPRRRDIRTRPEHSADGRAGKLADRLIDHHRYIREARPGYAVDPRLAVAERVLAALRSSSTRTFKTTGECLR
jgi:hypothetical protein